MEKNMKPYLVDVPVRVNIWIRPKCQRMQFKVLRQARPSIIFLQSDGGRNEKEWAAIRENRRLFDEEVDWDCTIYRIYEDHNLGLYTMGRKVHEFIWSMVDRCVFLEDDYVPAVSFFRYCAEMLERYKDDLRIECICGMNNLGESPEVTSDYFFAREGSIWGTATWRNRIADHDPKHGYANDEYVMGLLRQNTADRPSAWRRIDGYAHDNNHEGHSAGIEFYRMLSVYAQHRLYVIPRRNMICNVGCDEDAAHTNNMFLMSDGYRRLFNMKTHEMEFPIKHARYVIPDDEYMRRVHDMMDVDISRGKRLVRRIAICWRLLREGQLLKGLATRMHLSKPAHES